MRLIISLATRIDMAIAIAPFRDLVVYLPNAGPMCVCACGGGGGRGGGGQEDMSCLAANRPLMAHCSTLP